MCTPGIRLQPRAQPLEAVAAAVAGRGLTPRKPFPGELNLLFLVYLGIPLLRVLCLWFVPRLYLHRASSIPIRNMNITWENGNAT